MTVDVVRRSRRRASATIPAPEPEPTFIPAATIAIGEFDQTVFDCPSCSRPLALGARLCPGCRTRLVNGVALSKASVFIAAGLAIGLLVGGAGGLLLGLTRTSAATAGTGGPGPNATALPGAGATGSSRPGATNPVATPAATPNGIPPVTRSALVQVVGTNGRLATVAGDLRAILAANSFDASAVAQVLRSASADSVFGQQLAVRIAEWSESGALAAQLGSFYGAIHDTAVAGLDASVRNTAVYKVAAKDMLSLLDGLTAIDTAVRAAAASAGVELPATAIP